MKSSMHTNRDGSFCSLGEGMMISVLLSTKRMESTACVPQAGLLIEPRQHIPNLSGKNVIDYISLVRAIECQ